MKSISSAHNPMVKKAVSLKERKGRDASGLFLIEGYRECTRAQAAGISIQTLLICPELFLGVNEQGVISAAEEAGAHVVCCSSSLFAKLSYRDRPDGLIAIARQMQRRLPDLFPIVLKSANPFLIVAEAIEKPGNLGTILRSADAVGVDGVIVCDRCTDIYNPNVVRASVGTLFTIPVVEAGGAETLSWLRERNIRVVAATPSAELEYTDADFTGPVALAVGTEQLGLSEIWLRASDIQVRIPMKGVADSLNVATATTLLLYEVVRQRTRAAL